MAKDLKDYTSEELLEYLCKNYLIADLIRFIANYCKDGFGDSLWLWLNSEMTKYADIIRAHNAKMANKKPCNCIHCKKV